MSKTTIKEEVTEQEALLKSIEMGIAALLNIENDIGIISKKDISSKIFNMKMVIDNDLMTHLLKNKFNMPVFLIKPLINNYTESVLRKRYIVFKEEGYLEKNYIHKLMPTIKDGNIEIRFEFYKLDTTLDLEYKDNSVIQADEINYSFSFVDLTVVK